MLEVKTTHMRAKCYLGTPRPLGLMAGGLVGEALQSGAGVKPLQLVECVIHTSGRV